MSQNSVGNAFWTVAAKEVAVQELLPTDEESVGDVDIGDEDLGVFGYVTEGSQGGSGLRVGDYGVGAARMVGLSEGGFEEETNWCVKGGSQGKRID